MKILILGGTKFLGKHFTILAGAAGHDITHLNRGQTNPGLFPLVEHLSGDRDGGLDVLRGRTWDRVLDTCGYFPRIVGASARLLADATEHYTFVSSISVYRDFSVTGIDETAPVGTIPDETVETIDGETYGPLKALCELAVENALPGRTLTVRPGLIVGPDDHSFRFPYWVERLSQGGDVLAPGWPDRPVQVVDVRDLARWILANMEAKATGTFNVTGLDDELTFRDFLRRSIAALGTSVDPTWVDDAFLVAREVGAWVEMPLWIPGDEAPGLEQVSIRKALATGLTFRPLEETVRDTLAWIRTLPGDYERKAGLDPEKERTLLAAWRDSRSGTS